MSDPARPQLPESAHDVTLHLPTGEPEDPYSTRRLERTDPVLQPATLKGSPMADEAGQTQKLVIPLPPRWGASGETAPGIQAPVEAATQADPTGKTSGMGWKIPLLMGSLVVVGAVAYLLFPRSEMVPKPAPGLEPQPSEAVPEAAKPYLEQAQKGDPNAMRMLGVMYYYGLSVPKDRQKGLFWYRKAAEKGSNAAREELRKLESGS